MIKTKLCIFNHRDLNASYVCIKNAVGISGADKDFIKKKIPGNERIYNCEELRIAYYTDKCFRDVCIRDCALTGVYRLGECIKVARGVGCMCWSCVDRRQP